MTWLPGPLARVLLISLLSALCNFGLAAGILHESNVADVALAFGFLVAMFGWLAADVRRFGFWPGHHYALLMLIAAPLVIPHYALRTRGRSGVWLALVLEVALFAPLVAYYAGYWIYPYVPEFLWAEEP